MKRLYIAAVLLAAVAVLCALTHLYHRQQIDRMLIAIDRIEETYRLGDTDRAVKIAEDFAADYQHISDRISCYVPHGELRESRETAALLPTLLREGEREELFMEMTRLRAQLLYIRKVDDPTLQNIL